MDRIWGIGLAADDARAESPEQWRGLNLLGFALMEVRARLQPGPVGRSPAGHASFIRMVSMKASQGRHRKPLAGGQAPLSRRAPKKPVPLSVKERRVMRLIAALAMVFGGMLLLKVVFTIQSGTAWDDLSTSSRETQGFEFWSFVLVYLVMGAGLVWQGVNLWRTR